jgi:transglutaminase-like putative cysteine protease
VTTSQALYRVRHHYRYVYTAPVTDMRQRLIMIPPDRHGDQVLMSFDLEVRGASGCTSMEWQTDMFGNRVARVEAQHVEHAVDFEARFSVRRGDAQPGLAELLPDQLKAYLSFTALTAPDPRIHAAALDIASQASSPLECAELAHDWTSQAITYQLGVTGTQTPAAMALHLGEGVCQDYTHIMLSLLRTMGIPARYVSGHLLGEGAPHAWTEVLHFDAQQTCVVGYDPTHHRRAGPTYVAVAIGRDFADVSPTSGVFSGPAAGKLHWSKQAEVIDRPNRTTWRRPPRERAIDY